MKDPITMTQKAAEFVKASLVKRGRGIGLRLAVKNGGCADWSYVLDYVDESNESDLKFPYDDGLSVFVDPESYPYLSGTEIDLQEQDFGKRLVFNNPKQGSACGCGESFSVKPD